MKTVPVKEIYQVFLDHPVISKDTRSIPQNCIYLALKGESFDGNKFASDALKKGASYAIIDNPDYKVDERYLLVEDSLACLQELANYHRKQFNIPIIAISGSNGKTTTKELIATTLSEKYNTLYTQGNYNNHIGVPLTLLNLNSDHQMAVIEMGANHQKEIDFLCSIAEPTHGLLTNIGKSHLEGFGGIEGVKKGKSELYRFLEKTNGTVFLNTDDDVLKSLSKSDKTIDYGTSGNEYCSGVLNETHPTLIGSWKCKNNSGKISSKLYGEYNFYNIMAAICIGNFFSVEANDIDKAIGSYESTMNRSQLIKKDSYTILMDAYNANPTSTELAIKNLEKDASLKKIAILGDMFELGEEAKAEHLKIIQEASNLSSIDKFIFVGQNYFQHKDNNTSRLFFESTSEAKEWFQDFNKSDYTILLKGSRGMKMESLLK